MKYLNPDDPEFTAKALGEHIDEQSESQIPEEFREEFDALQQFAESVKASVAGKQTGDNLGDHRVAKIRASLSKKSRVIPFPYWGGAIAAALAVMLVLPLYRPAVEQQMIDENQVKPRNELKKDDADMAKGPLDSDVEGEGLKQIVALDQISEKPEGKESLNRELILGTPTMSTGQESEPVVAMDEEGPSEEEKYEMSPFEVVLGDDIENKPTPGIRLCTKFIDSPEESMNEEVFGYSASTQAAGVQGDFIDGEHDLSGMQPVKYESLSVPMTKTMPGPGIEVLQPAVFNREGYAHIEENTFKSPLDVPLSTFSIDVDTASYSNVRRMLGYGMLPQPDAVRIEEMVNYFHYSYQPPVDDKPFAVHVDAADEPWQPEHRLVRIALKGSEVAKADRPAANLVFLVDVSGSMNDRNKLPLVIESLSLLVEQMNADDRIAIVVYAGASGLVLPSTTANNQETILHALSQLRAGGSTNGGAGIELAYREAEKHLIKGKAINRVILCTDGDFNVGTTDQGSLVRLIEKKAKSGVFFSAIGFGSGNYQDSTMEQLSNKGNGNYAYIDSVAEARKVFVSDMLGTLMTIAKDVKIQVEFNPAKVQSYRLIGYENRALAKEDFNDDKKDAGEIGAGHSVTALYEIVPVGVGESNHIPVDDLKYQSKPKTDAGSDSSEWLTVKLRYKLPNEDTSKLIEVPFTDDGDTLARQDDDFRFATGIAAFAMKLRGSEYAGGYSYDDIYDLLRSSTGSDEDGLRSEALSLVRQVADLTNQE